MRLRSVVCLFALVFLIGCSGGGTSGVAGGGTPAPPPGPQTKVTMKVQVDLEDQGRAIQASSLQRPLVLVVAEVVDRFASDPGSLSGRRVVAQGQADVNSDDSVVTITMEVPVGDWDLYVFGIDETGLPPAARSTPQSIAVTPGINLVLQSQVLYDNEFVVVTSDDTDGVIEVGQTANFSATVNFADGTFSNSVTWQSSDPTVATIDANGVATGVAPGGPVTITATSTSDPGLQGTAQLTVIPAAVQQVTVNFSLNPAVLDVGDTGQLTADALFTNGQTQTGVPATFTSDDPAVLTVDSAGLATAQGPGTANVIASFGGVDSAPFPVTVNPNSPRIVVVDSAFGGSTVTSFLEDQATGVLTQADSTPLGGIIGQNITADTVNDLVAVDRSNGGVQDVVAFQVANDGALTLIPVPGGPFAQVPAILLKLGRLYVAEGNGVANDTIDTFEFNAGAFSTVATDFDTLHNNVRDLAVNTTIPALYAGIFLGGPNSELLGMNLAATGEPTALIPGPAVFLGANQVVKAHPTGNFVIQGSSGTPSTVQTFSFDGAGVLNAAPTATVNPAGNNVLDMAVSTDGQFLYVLSSAGVATFIDSYQIGGGGALTPVDSVNLGSDQILSLIVDPNGQFVFFANFDQGQVGRVPVSAGAMGAPAVAASGIPNVFQIEVVP